MVEFVERSWKNRSRVVPNTPIGVLGRKRGERVRERL
jgi:hypothetical protein